MSKGFLSCIRKKAIALKGLKELLLQQLYSEKHINIFPVHSMDASSITSRIIKNERFYLVIVFPCIDKLHIFLKLHNFITFEEYLTDFQKMI